MSSLKFHPLKVKNVNKITSDAVSITFEVPEEYRELYRFTQGQNITIRKTFNGEEVRRSYSLCTSPLDGEITVGIKEVENGLFSTFANRELKAGDVLDVMPPSGHFYTELNPANAKSYFAFAAGSGITPILSIIKTTLAVEPGSRFTLVYGNRTTGSIMFLEEIEALKNRYMDRFSVFYILSRETVDVPLLNGRISGQKCKEMQEQGLIDCKVADDVFLCGPEEMIHSVKDELSTLISNPKNIHFELFTTSTHTISSQSTKVAGNGNTAAKTAVSSVSVRIDGITYKMELPYDGESILDAALKTGADLPFACKGGVCCTCRAKVTSGSAVMDMNFSLEDDEVEKGYILTCQSHPASDEIFVDFDIK